MNSLHKMLCLLVLISTSAVLSAEIIHVVSIDSKHFYVCDEPINIRSEGSLSGSVLDKLYIGEIVEILGEGEYAQLDGTENNKWYKIKYQSDKIGWIYGKYLATQTIVLDLDQNGALDYIFVQMHANHHL